jgi:hypothetical protein
MLPAKGRPCHLLLPSIELCQHYGGQKSWCRVFLGWKSIFKVFSHKNT